MEYFLSTSSDAFIIQTTQLLAVGKDIHTQQPF